MLRPALVAALAVVAVPCAAFAQDAAAAAAHFERGLADMMAGKYETGCPALAESYALDPKPGALFTLAECEAKWGKLASAVTHYGEYLDLYQRMPPDMQANQRGRDKIAADQKASLAPDVPQLTVVLPSGAPAGTVVRRDGHTLGAPSLGVALPTDPGEHVITIEIPNGEKRDEHVTLEKGDKKRLDLVLPSKATVNEHAKETREEPNPSGGVRPMRTVGFVLGGVGLAGVALGGVMGVLTMQKKKTIEDHCVSDVCDPDGLDAASSSKTFGLVSTIGFAAGGALLVTGVVLVLATPAKKARTGEVRIEARPLASLRGAQAGTVGLSGAW